MKIDIGEAIIPGALGAVVGYTVGGKKAAIALGGVMAVAAGLTGGAKDSQSKAVSAIQRAIRSADVTRDMQAAAAEDPMALAPAT